MTRALVTFLLLSLGAAGLAPAWAKSGDHRAHKGHANKHVPASKPRPAADSDAERRLVEVYKLANPDSKQALEKARELTRDYPSFRAAQLVYADLLMLRSQPVPAASQMASRLAPSATIALSELREQARLRLQAFAQRPPANTVPSQFVQLSAANKHAIAIDASKNRLYLFENSTAGVKLIGDYYVSLGKFGVDKSAEGDFRTPLGVYFVQTNLDPRSLKQFYGAGALPLNYPNPFDVRRGKSGKGIWLHGSPPNEFARAPKATDGCVVLSNPDLAKLIATVEIRTTPVVIAPSLKWVAPQTLATQAKHFGETIQMWRHAREAGDTARMPTFYARDFIANGLDASEGDAKAELPKVAGRKVTLDDISYLNWSEAADTMVVTFKESVEGERASRIKRQYWLKDGPAWKIIFEGAIG